MESNSFQQKKKNKWTMIFLASTSTTNRIFYSFTTQWKAMVIWYWLAFLSSVILKQTFGIRQAFQSILQFETGALG